MEGGEAVARALLAVLETSTGDYTPAYELNQPVLGKIEQVATRVYGASGVKLSAAARKDISEFESLGYGDLPICIAKTQNSLSDDPKLRNRPVGFEIHVERVLLNAGAGFLVVVTGEIMRMPGLSKVPAATRIDVVDGQIVGVG